MRQKKWKKKVAKKLYSWYKNWMFRNWKEKEKEKEKEEGRR
jgi:hypothetical protein